MNFELKGKLIEIFPEQQVSDSFKKREFVVETSEEGGGRIFTEQIKFQLIQDKCSLLESMNLNQEVKVSFNIKGRRWEKDGKVNYFTNLDAWRVEAVEGTQPVQSNYQAPTEMNPADIAMNEEDEDLPF